MKAVFHKSCSCYSCRRGRGRDFGQYIQNQNERKLRRGSNKALRDVLLGRKDDAVIAPISSPYTD